VRAALVLEFLLLFWVAPAVLAMRPDPWQPLIVLWAVTLYCRLFLRRQPEFTGGDWWRAAAIQAQKRSIFGLFVPVACILALGVRTWTPGAFLKLPRTHPVVWCLMLALYPTLSVIPQTLIYRAFLFTRYRPIFRGEWHLIAASAASFSWMHVVMRNPVAPLLTLPAGALFAWRYARSGSVAASALEHTLYGYAVFTLGLGAYFYAGGIEVIR
jgi:membrane protease YdiL (CAAX protease family)